MYEILSGSASASAGASAPSTSDEAPMSPMSPRISKRYWSCRSETGRKWWSINERFRMQHKGERGKDAP